MTPTVPTGSPTSTAATRVHVAPTSSAHSKPATPTRWCTFSTRALACHAATTSAARPSASDKSVSSSRSVFQMTVPTATTVRGCVWTNVSTVATTSAAEAANPHWPATSQTCKLAHAGPCYKQNV